MKFGKEQLKAFIERVERLEEEKKVIADDIRDVYAEAKGSGFDVKALRAIMRLRKIPTNVGNSRRFWRRICMRSAWISGAEGTGGDRGSNVRRRHSLIRGQFSVFVDPSPRLSPTIMPSHASSQAHCSSGSSRTASDRLSRRRHSDGDTPIIEDRPSNAAPVRARNAAKLQKFQRPPSG